MLVIFFNFSHYVKKQNEICLDATQLIDVMSLYH